mmetsp:Transcript_85553/g.228866  ORF Transcript_85553/g.228866 Transcript_85553/m.228866 type:complete len:228 (-) Transcript_85553:615-1298(-)
MLDTLIRASHGHWMRLVRRPPAQRIGVEPLLQVLAQAHHGNRRQPCRQSLGAGQNIRHDAGEMLKREKLTGTTEAHHDLIENQQNLVLVAQRPDPLQISRRRHQRPIGPYDRLKHDGRNRIRPFHLDLLFQGLQASSGGRLVRGSPAEPQRLRVENLHESAAAGLRKPSPEITSRPERRSGTPVVRPILGHDLGLPSEPPRNADSGFVGFSSTAREQKPGDICWADL